MNVTILVYVASPYSSPQYDVRLQRYYAAEWYCAELVRSGLFAFSPVVHWHNCAFWYDLPFDADFWRDYNARMLSHCDQLDVLKLPGWQESVGVQYEITLAKEQNKIVNFVVQ